MRGWVYVLSNKSMPGLVKIGFSTKDPELRAVELRSTGNPSAYDVEYDVLVDEPRTIEQNTHRQLASSREGREWFRLTVAAAIIEIKKTIGSRPHLESYKRTTEAEVITKTNAQRVHVIQLQTAIHAEKTRIAEAFNLERARLDQEREALLSERANDSTKAEIALEKVDFRRASHAVYWLIGFLALLLLPLVLDEFDRAMRAGGPARSLRSTDQLSGEQLFILCLAGVILVLYFGCKFLREFFDSKLSSLQHPRDRALAPIDRQVQLVTDQIETSHAREKAALQACAHKFT